MSLFERLTPWKNAKRKAQAELLAELDKLKIDQDKLTRIKSIIEEGRWSFVDEDWDGLKDFKGNPWQLPGIGDL